MTLHSYVPVAAILLPIGAFPIVYLVGLRWRRGAGPLAATVLGATLGLCAWIARIVFGSGAPYTPLVAAERHFLALHVDALSAFMLIPIGLLGFLAALFSLQALPALIARGHGRAERVPMYYALLTLFVGTMIWACTTNNIVVLWIAVEATTIASGLLVAFYWDRRALEAGYKYLLLLSVGVTFALFGCVLLYAAGAGQAPSAQAIEPMLITEITQHAGMLATHARSVVVLATILLVVGFGTKAGLVPLHAWLPDAHSEAPAAVSVLLSGIVIKVGAYALARCTLPFLAYVPGLSVALLVLAAVGMLAGMAACAVQDDLKRMLAYSSVSQIAYVVMGLALGTAAGIFGGLFHLLNHALAKALLFFAAGSVEHGTGERALSRLGGLRSRMPLTAAAFFLGALALGGMPGLNGFLSKLTIFLAAAKAGVWWAAAAAVVAGLLTLVVLLRAGTKVFLGPPPDGRAATASEVPALMSVPMIVLVVLCLLLGLWPPLASSLVGPVADAVAGSLPGLGAATQWTGLP